MEQRIYLFVFLGHTLKLDFCWENATVRSDDKDSDSVYLTFCKLKCPNATDNMREKYFWYCSNLLQVLLLLVGLFEVHVGPAVWLRNCVTKHLGATVCKCT